MVLIQYVKNGLSARFLGVLILIIWADTSSLYAEYGDIILNDHAEQEDMRPVVFPHWFHRIRFRCKVCHNELGFKMRAGSNKISMGDIIEGKFCGHCHNGNIAWSAANCDLCHSGKRGLPTGVQGGAQTSGPGYW